MINTIYLEEAPKAVSSMILQMDAESGDIWGALEIDFYNVANGTNTYTPVEIKNVPTGLKDGVFGPTNTPTPTPIPSDSPEKDKNPTVKDKNDNKNKK